MEDKNCTDVERPSCPHVPLLILQLVNLEPIIYKIDYLCMLVDIFLNNPSMFKYTMILIVSRY